MTTQQLAAMKQALEALKWANKEINEWREDAYGYDAKDQPTIMSAVNAINEALAQPEQEPGAWPCLIDSVDFSENTITLVMQCDDYKVSAGTHWLSTTPPQRKPLTDEEIQYAFRTNSVMVDNGNAYMVAGMRAVNITRAIEAAHGIKGEA